MLYLRGFYLSQSKVKLFASEKSHIFLIVRSPYFQLYHCPWRLGPWLSNFQRNWVGTVRSPWLNGRILVKSQNYNGICKNAARARRHRVKLRGVWLNILNSLTKEQRHRLLLTSTGQPLPLVTSPFINQSTGKPKCAKNCCKLLNRWDATNTSYLTFNMLAWFMKLTLG